MSNELLLVHYNGNWTTEIKYEGYEVCGIHHKETETFDELAEGLKKMVNINSSRTRLEIRYQIREGYKPITVNNDMSLKFLKELKKVENDYTKIPLCVTFEAVERHELILENFARGNENLPIEVQPLELVAHDFFNTDYDVNNEVVEIGKKCSKTLLEVACETMEFLEGKHSKENVLSNCNGGDRMIEAGQTFPNKEELKKFLSLYAINNHFQYMVEKSCQKQYYIKCIDKSCPWRLKASRIGCAPTFKIRKVNDEHRCSFGCRMNDKRQATANIIGHCIEDKFENLKTTYTPADIIRDMKKLCGVNLSYKKAWRARQKALEKVYGHPYKSYQLLPRYLEELVDANPGSIMNLKTDSAHRFEYVFISLEASIKGWENCRPIIIVDGTFLKATYGGMLITASTQDAAGHTLLLAYGVVDSENNNAYIWFFTNLKSALQERTGLCFVSDRHNSIKNAIGKVFPEAAHCFCTYHLSKNIVRNYKENLEVVKGAFFAAAYSYRKDDFNDHMETIRKANLKAFEFLTKTIGVEEWSRVHCPSNRFSVMTSNAAETINSTMKVARELPITGLLESVQEMQQGWNVKNRKEAQNTFTKLAKLGQRMIEENYRLSMKYTVHQASDDIYRVKFGTQIFIVDMKKMTCTCNRFQMDELPCAHALGIMRGKHEEPEDYCSRYYYTSTLLATYNSTVFPVAYEMRKDGFSANIEDLIKPHEEITLTGRRKKKRFISAWEKGSKRMRV